ncbi:MAG: hypothetical protein H0U05_12830 [Actinobacteria bacterium]|nr:hypothetical protein [Actinomycetota bacterium]
MGGHIVALALRDLLELDEIGGAAYERVLVPAETDAGEFVITNLYAGV